MRANVKFRLKITIGLFGSFAIMELSEEATANFSFDGELSCVKQDIRDSGLSEWWENLKNTPEEPGTYNVDGSAYFTEDSADYGEVKYQRL